MHPGEDLRVPHDWRLQAEVEPPTRYCLPLDFRRPDGRGTEEEPTV